ncbi:MAG: DUF92 domain-containing protein [Anaerolineae bacterium]|nr:DUF92 domain-containing protein [Anaerolineae bacterium]
MSLFSNQIFIGIVLAALVSTLAYLARTLRPQGALAAFVLGAVIFGLGGFSWAVLLLGFFISSSALSKLFKRHKSNLDEKYAKGSTRDAGQVLANGGIAGIFVIAHYLFPSAEWTWMAYAGALAAVNADTWATELGALSRKLPRLITTGKTVEPGTSGGITLLGTLSAFLGAFFIAFLAILTWVGSPLATLQHILGALISISLAGLLGSLIDSLLGATLQAIYTCPTCNKETERHPLHLCGTPTIFKRGIHWMNNDWVNAICSLGGALGALLAALL